MRFPSGAGWQGSTPSIVSPVTARDWRDCAWLDTTVTVSVA
jgi:hypothetical protein